jgi:murein endopeptidase
MRMRTSAGLGVLCAALCLAAPVSAEDAPPGTGPPMLSPPPLFPPAPGERVVWRRSKAVGKPWRGRLVRGVKLPSYGTDWFTYDWGTRSVPNRIWRRYGHERLVRMLLRVVGEFRLAHPEAPRVGIADLSRPRGGPFGRRYGGLGHASHQNGLDVDVLYPRLDGQENRPERVRQINRALAQDLVNRFVAAGAQKVFVGPHTKLRGKRRVVTPLRSHDDHMHVRIKPRRGGR